MAKYLLCVLGPVSDAEGESELGLDNECESPRPLATKPAAGVYRPTPCRVSCRRRQAVERIEDLLQGDPEDEPLNLCLKRPKSF